jgi:hypothetical protein
MTGGHDRFVPIEKGIYDNLAGAVSPYPYEAGFATDWGSFHHEKLGHFYFFGGVFAVLFALQAVAFWIFLPDRQAWARAWWVPCGIVAFLMVLGEPGYLWQGLGMLPMSKFFLRYSFRFYPWLAFCAILSGGLVLEQFLAMVRRREPWEFVAGGLMLAVLAYHLMMCQPSFYSYGFQPYPPLPAEFEAAFHPYGDKSYIGDRNSKRIASWAELRSVSPNFPAGLPLNLPHHYQTPSVFGYDPIVEGQADFKEVLRRIEKDPLEACRRYGIGWHLFTDGPVHSSSNGLFRMESTLASELGAKSLRNAELTTIARHEGVTLKELLDVDPLAFVTDRPSRPLPMHLHGRGADIEVGGLAAGTRVTINFLMRPHMSLLLDDQPITIDKDDWNRITTTLPESGAVLSLRYEPPWRRTCGIGAALCFVALVLAGVTIRLNS